MEYSKLSINSSRAENLRRNGSQGLPRQAVKAVNLQQTRTHFRDVYDVDDVLDRIVSFLLEDELSGRFGSQVERLSFALVCKRFAGFLQFKRARQHVYYSNGISFEQPINARMREVIIENANDLFHDGQEVSFNVGTTLIIRCSRVTLRDLQILAKLRDNLSCLTLEGCRLELAERPCFQNFIAFQRLRQFQKRCIAFLAQVILPFQDVDVTVTFPQITWHTVDTEDEIAGQVISRASSSKKLSLRLRASDGLGCILHWYCHLGENLAFEPWQEVDMIIVHRDIRSICDHHSLLFGPICLIKSYYEMLQIAQPEENMPDLNHVISRFWEFERWSR